jgi:hypothetical protein
MANVYPPKIDTFLIADAVRQEASKKATIIGAFAGGQIFVSPGSTFPVAFPMAIYAVFSEGEGTFKGGLNILDPNNNPLGPDIAVGEVTKTAEQPLQMILNFTLFPFPKAGVYTTKISLDDHVYLEKFSIAVSPVPIT